MERAAVAQNRMLREWLAANRVAVGRLWAELGFVSAPAVHTWPSTLCWSLYTHHDSVIYHCTHTGALRHPHRAVATRSPLPRPAAASSTSRPTASSPRSRAGTQARRRASPCLSAVPPLLHLLLECPHRHSSKPTAIHRASTTVASTTSTTVASTTSTTLTSTTFTTAAHCFHHLSHSGLLSRCLRQRRPFHGPIF